MLAIHLPYNHTIILKLINLSKQNYNRTILRGFNSSSLKIQFIKILLQIVFLQKFFQISSNLLTSSKNYREQELLLNIFSKNVCVAIVAHTSKRISQIPLRIVLNHNLLSSKSLTWLSFWYFLTVALEFSVAFCRKIIFF